MPSSGKGCGGGAPKEGGWQSSAAFAPAHRADQPISGAEQLAEEIGLPLLLEAPQGALAWRGEEGRPAPSLKRTQLEAARGLIERLPGLDRR